MKEPILLTGLLLVYSNLIGWWAARRGLSSADGAFRFTNPVLLLILLLLISKTRKQTVAATLAQMGLSRANAPKSLAAGAALGLGLALPPLFFFAKPIVLDSPVEYGPVSKLGTRSFLRLLFADLTITVALCEEAFFRGLLQDSWSRHSSEKVANIATAATFAGWHFAVTLGTLPDTNVLEKARLPKILLRHANLIALVGGMLSTAVAGVLFGLLRRWSGSLWGPVLAHWLVDSIMIAALWRRGQKSRQQGTNGKTSARTI